jgi:hypothetical protein
VGSGHRWFTRGSGWPAPDGSRASPAFWASADVVHLAWWRCSVALGTAEVRGGGLGRAQRGKRQSRVAAVCEEEIDLLAVGAQCVEAAHLAGGWFSHRRHAGARARAPHDPIAFSFMCRDSIAV